MAAPRVLYQLVGRYMDGKKVTGYHLHSMDTGKSGRYNLDQFAYLVGRGQVTNCEGQIYKDGVIYRGTNGTDIQSLPVQQEDGSISRTSNVGHIRRGETGQDVMNKLMFVAKIKRGRSTLGYVVQNSGGAQKKIDAQQAFELARAGRIGNARGQLWQGKQIIKGIDCNLNELPIIEA